MANRTNISADDRVVSNSKELQILFSKYRPRRGWFTTMGYAKTSTGLNKTNANRRPGNEEFGRSLHHWFIDRYLDSEDYGRVGQPNIGKNGKPLKTTHKATCPFEAEGVELVTFVEHTVRWKSGSYEDDCNRRRLIVNEYMAKPSRLARMTGPADPGVNPHAGDAAAFAKKAAAYCRGNGVEPIDLASLTPGVAAEVWNYVRPSAARASENDRPKLNFYDAHPMPVTKCFYYLVTPERGIEQVDGEFVRFWRREFGSAPSGTPGSELSALLDRLVPGRFQSYLMSNIAYMVFTCGEGEGAGAQRFLYINEELDLDGKPDVAKRLMKMSGIDKGQLESA